MNGRCMDGIRTLNDVLRSYNPYNVLWEWWYHGTSKICGGLRERRENEDSDTATKNFRPFILMVDSNATCLKSVTNGLFPQKSGQREFAARLWPRSHGAGSPLSNPGTPQVALSAGIAQRACSCDAPGKQACPKFASASTLEAGSWSK